jgi:hypothetical protein
VLEAFYAQKGFECLEQALCFRIGKLRAVSPELLVILQQNRPEWEFDSVWGCVVFEEWDDGVEKLLSGVLFGLECGCWWVQKMSDLVAICFFVVFDLVVNDALEQHQPEGGAEERIDVLLEQLFDGRWGCAL